MSKFFAGSIFGLVTIVVLVPMVVLAQYRADFSDYADIEVNNTDTPLSGLAPLPADFVITIDWNDLLPNLLQDQYNKDTLGSFDTDMQVINANATVVLEFDDGDILNPKQCGYLNQEAKNALCDQPLVKATLSVPYSGSTNKKLRFKNNKTKVDDNIKGVSNQMVDGVQIAEVTHTYFYEKSFKAKVYIDYNPKLISKVVVKGGRKAKYLLGEYTINVSYPKPQAVILPPTAPAGTTRSLSVTCAPGSEFFAVKSIQGSSNDSILLSDNPNFKYMNNLYVYQQARARKINVAINPDQETVYEVRCIPEGSLDYKAKYNKYKKYIKFPEKTYASTTVTAKIEDTCEPSTMCLNGDSVSIDEQCKTTTTQCDYGCFDGLCLEEPVAECEVVSSCYNNQIVQTQNADCSNTYSACSSDTSCLAGACVSDPNNCTLPEGLYCKDGDVYSASNDCRQLLVESCSYGCTAGACNASASMDTVSNLKAVPPLVPKGGTAEISWDVANAASCRVVGGKNSWSNVRGRNMTSPIEEETTFTLKCMGNYGDTLEESVTVRVLPIWQEI